ncbi:FMN-binding negative transcriptional regulator [Pseudomonas sp. LRF_L74]|uniref:FMN-binding negative transcriptional regulator n=1 Tax=Pseudomonas sp. LRF_L74 TaxID=3369422 RepID=UPI003F5EBCC7
MYRPAAFRQDDLSTLHQQIRTSRLASVISQGRDDLLASHLPLLLVESEGEKGTLYGHFARANPHWRELLGQPQTLVVFNGVDAYVSPTWYPSKAEHGKAVPTWNYIAVHAHGQAVIFDDAERLRWLVGTLSAQHESGRARPWSIDDAPKDYLDAMLRAIVGFALPIERLEGQWKLSQNRSDADREGVRRGLADSDDARDRETATYLPTETETIR